MDQIIDFLSKNKDWLFSGVGTTIVSSFVGWFSYKQGFADGKQQSMKLGNNSKGMQQNQNNTGGWNQQAGGNIKN